MIYFFSPVPTTPSGGVWYIHKLVKLLNFTGKPAQVVMEEKKPVWWDFDPIPESMVITGDEWAKIPQTDDSVYVIPEFMWVDFNKKLPNRRKILFVQSTQWMDERDPSLYKGAETVVVSRHLGNYMSRVYGLPSKKITPFVDQEFWHPTAKTTNKTLVMARANPYHEKMKVALEAAGYPVDYVTEPLTQEQLREHLSSCEFYVHLRHPEGWPMACVEAARMGTIVVGTTGGGGNEFMFNKETAMVVQDPKAGHYDSEDEFVRRIMEQMHFLSNDAEARSRIWNAAYNWCSKYTYQNTVEELIKVFP